MVASHHRVGSFVEKPRPRRSREPLDSAQQCSSVLIILPQGGEAVTGIGVDVVLELRHLLAIRPRAQA